MLCLVVTRNHLPLPEAMNLLKYLLGVMSYLSPAVLLLLLKFRVVVKKGKTLKGL